MARKPVQHRKAERPACRDAMVPQRHPGGQAPAPPDSHRPLWAPSGVDLEGVPPEVRQAIVQIIEPAYQQFVLGAADALERWIGTTLVHLLWLETLHQFDMKREYVRFACLTDFAATSESAITHHLRLIESKMKIGGFLLRLRQMRERLGDQGAWPLDAPASGEKGAG